MSTCLGKDVTFLVQCQEVGALLWVILLQHTSTMLDHHLRERGRRWAEGDDKVVFTAVNGGDPHMKDKHTHT